MKVVGNAMNITLSGTEDLLAVDDLGQALQDMNSHIDDVTVKINQQKRSRCLQMEEKMSETAVAAQDSS